VSTKIWEACRFRQSRLNEFLDLVRSQGMGMVFKRAKFIHDAIKEEAVKKQIEWENRWERNEEKRLANLQDPIRQKMARGEILKRMIEEAAHQRERTPVDLECGVNLWLYKKYWYGIPIGEGWRGVDAVFPEWVEEFHYQTSTDKPEEISQRKWDYRGEIWEAICLGNDFPDKWNIRRLFFSIFDPKRSLDVIQVRFSLVEEPIIRENEAKRSIANIDV